jgi:hypothetical protein
MKRKPTFSTASMSEAAVLLRFRGGSSVTAEDTSVPSPSSREGSSLVSLALKKGSAPKNEHHAEKDGDVDLRHATEEGGRFCRFCPLDGLRMTNSKLSVDLRQQAVSRGVTNARLPSAGRESTRTNLRSNKVPHGVARRRNIRSAFAVICHKYVYRAAAVVNTPLSARAAGLKTHGSSLYTSCPSSALSCTKRSSRETMMFTRRESMAFSSGRITWLLTYMQNIDPHQCARVGTSRIGNAQDEWAERRCG